MKLFKKKDKNIEAEETLAKNAESAKTAADGKNAGAAQQKNGKQGGCHFAEIQLFCLPAIFYLFRTCEN